MKESLFILSLFLGALAIPAAGAPAAEDPDSESDELSSFYDGAKKKEKAPEVKAAVGKAKKPEAKGKLISFDPAAMDKSADPCSDFFQYSCGGWLAKTEIPSDQARWGRFNELAENNHAILRRILEKAAKPGRTRGAIDQKIGDLYASCMDERMAEKKGAQPLKPLLDRIDAIRGPADMPAAFAKLGNINAVFSISSDQDFKDATEVIAQIGQAGLGLPDRDYYFKEDKKSVELREQYVAHIEKMFTLLGEPAEKAAQSAKTVMSIETELARASQDNVARRNPKNVYHRMDMDQLSALAPKFDWRRYLADVQAPELQSVNVESPDFIKRFGQMLESVPPADWKTYLRWHSVRAAAPLLSSAFVNENFKFYGQTLTGAKEIKPRWKRCVALADGALGEALGQRYVEQYFPKQSKKRMLRLIKGLERALKEDIDALPWMTPATKREAQAKLAAMANKIGYPERWRDYSKLEIRRDDLLGNGMRADEFEIRRQLAKIGRPVDKKEWFMSPPTVNAYYHPLMNNINFPAGILQPPFFDAAIDDAVNYGAIGGVIGHELTHGFDDQGRQFDDKGNLRDWWTPEDGKAFEERAACIEKQYSQYTAVDDLKLNGQLTLGENVADNGGLRIALMALQNSLKGKQPRKIDGYTPEQRLFVGWGQVWCTKMTDQEARRLALTDPHSPGKYRVNGVVANMPEFAQTFGCKAGSPMVSPNPCRVW